jgi:predicted dehydrogenase
MKIPDTPQPSNLSRRDFVKGSTVAGLAALLTNTSRIHAAGSDKIRVGIIGCGRRGTFDAKNCVKSSENVVITAMGDLFADKLENCRNYLKEKLPDKVQVTNENCFVGWNAYKDVLKTDIDLVILTETPHFSPAHLRAAVEAGKHVFMEKPVAVDPVGVRSVIESSRLAEEKILPSLPEPN